MHHTVICSECGTIVSDPDMDETNLFEKIYNYIKARDKAENYNFDKAHISEKIPTSDVTNYDKNSAFCPKCRKVKRRTADYEIRDMKVVKRIRDLDIEYNEKHIFCKECGTEIYMPSIHDINVESYMDAMKGGFIHG